MATSSEGLARHLPVLRTASVPRVGLPEMVSSLLSAAGDVIGWVVSTPRTALEVAERADRALKVVERLDYLTESAIDRLDSILVRAGTMDRHAAEINDKLPTAIDQLSATENALRDARTEIQGLSSHLDSFEALAARIAGMEAHVAQMNEHLAVMIRRTQPIGDAQEAAQRFRDTLKFGSRRRGKSG